MGVQVEELVVLVDEDGTAIGTRPKAEVHGADTPLHRAFSCYVFDSAGRLLLTRRALDKRTFPGVWTNTVCGHPAPGEADADAIARRSADELGLAVHDLTLVLPDFRYQAVFDGVMENEICPVYLARTDSEPLPNPAEVADHAWVRWEDAVERATEPSELSYWCRRQVEQLSRTERLGAYVGRQREAVHRGQP